MNRHHSARFRSSEQIANNGENRNCAGLKPMHAEERREWLDALRGFALLGIALYNVQAFSGYAFRGLQPTAPRAWDAFDPALDFAAHVLIQGKFHFVLYPSDWMRRALQLSLPRIFGIYLLGMWTTRIGLLAARCAPEHSAAVAGVGIPARATVVHRALGIGGNDALLPTSPTGLPEISLASLGMPLLCLA